VHQYNKPEATDYLEEWLDFFRSGHIKDDTRAPGLKEARERLLYMKMSKQERIAYDRHLDDIMVENDIYDTAVEDGMAIGEKKGRAEGEAIGMEKGRAEERISMARNLLAMGVLTIEQIAQATGLSVDEIERLLL